MTNILCITKAKRTLNGLWDLNLDAFQGKKWIGRMLVNSGAPTRQVFRTEPRQRSGSLEPIPEGHYILGSLDWAGKPGDYATQFPAIKSPIWVVIMRDRAIGFHLDGNRGYAPGSAGCIVFKTLDDLKRFVGWWNEVGGFRDCLVDWGLGYAPLPKELRR